MMCGEDNIEAELDGRSRRWALGGRIYQSPWQLHVMGELAHRLGDCLCLAIDRCAPNVVFYPFSVVSLLSFTRRCASPAHSRRRLPRICPTRPLSLLLNTPPAGIISFPSLSSSSSSSPC